MKTSPLGIAHPINNITRGLVYILPGRGRLIFFPFLLNSVEVVFQNARKSSSRCCSHQSTSLVPEYYYIPHNSFLVPPLILLSSLGWEGGNSIPYFCSSAEVVLPDGLLIEGPHQYINMFYLRSTLLRNFFTKRFQMRCSYLIAKQASAHELTTRKRSLSTD